MKRRSFKMKTIIFVIAWILFFYMYAVLGFSWLFTLAVVTLVGIILSALFGVYKDDDDYQNKH